MKLLATSFGAFGHLLPMLPLARAAVAAGDQVTIATSADMNGVAPDLPFVVAGPSVSEVYAEHVRRTGIDPMAADQTTSPAARRSAYGLFTDTRIDMTFDAVLRTTRNEAPDVIVAEEWDFVAPLVAAAAGIPWLPLNHSPRTIADVELEQSAQIACERRGLAATAPIGRVQVWPEWLQGFGYVPVGDEIGARASAHCGDAPATAVYSFTEKRPVVLVSIGTASGDADLFDSAIRQALGADTNVVAVTSSMLQAEHLTTASEHLMTLPFTPLNDIFAAGVDAVVTIGGSGTVLAALCNGVPLVVAPQNFNQPVVADLIARQGAGLSCRHPAEIGHALRRVLGDSQFRERADEARRLFLGMPSADAAWQVIKRRLHVAGN